MNTITNIAIDGPAGAGKSTIAKMIAQQLGMIYVDTGAMYRAFGLYCFRHHINKEDEKAVNECLKDIDISIDYLDNTQQVLLNHENVTHLIRTKEIGQIASSISKYREVRIKLVELQRQLAQKTSVVMDGRDIGTVVLPKATIKVYLTAKVSVRAHRRWLELKEKGIEEDIISIEDAIRNRDYRDMNRKESPLKKAEDAIEIDTSDLTIQEVVDYILNLYRKYK
jgi:cytidylate kinase